MTHTQEEKVQAVAYYMRCGSINKTSGEYSVTVTNVRAWAETPSIVRKATLFNQNKVDQEEFVFNRDTITMFLSNVVAKLDGELDSMKMDTKIKYAGLLKDLLSKDVLPKTADKTNKSVVDELMQRFENGEIKAEA